MAIFHIQHWRRGFSFWGSLTIGLSLNESQRVVIPHGLGISKGLQEGVGLDDLVFQGSLIICEKRKREDFGRLPK